MPCVWSRKYRGLGLVVELKDFGEPSMRQKMLMLHSYQKGQELRTSLQKERK